MYVYQNRVAMEPVFSRDFVCGNVSVALDTRDSFVTLTSTSVNPTHVSAEGVQRHSQTCTRKSTLQFYHTRTKTASNPISIRL